MAVHVLRPVLPAGGFVGEEGEEEEADYGEEDGDEEVGHRALSLPAKNASISLQMSSILG